jgi:hypothetical protein
VKSAYANTPAEDEGVNEEGAPGKTPEENTEQTPGQEGGPEVEGVGDEICFDGENTYFKGRTYESISGPHGKGRLPEGDYTGDNLRTRTKDSMTDEYGFGWSLDLTPNFETDRDLLRVHPDGKGLGTEGCIGIQKDAWILYDDLRGYFDSGNTSVPVRVVY